MGKALTPLQQNFLRLRGDFPLYAKTNLKIKSKSGEVVPFALNGAQLYVYWRLEKQLAETGKVRAIILKGRQQGISTMIQAIFYHLTSLNRGKQAFVITHEQAATDNLFGITMRYHDNSVLKPQTGAANAKELTFALLESGYRIGTAGTKSVGRSSTFQLLHGSEVAFWPNSQEILSGLFQCVPNLDGTRIILESTANGVGNTYHQMWQDAVDGKSDFIPIFLSWTLQGEYRRNADGMVLTPEEMTLKRLYGLDNEQVAFRRAKIIELRSEDLFNQEYPLSAELAFLTSGRPAFDRLQLQQAQLNCLKPRKRMVLSGDKWADNKDGELRVWFDRNPKDTYSIGADVAMGIEGTGDYSCADVIENSTGCQVAQWHGKCSPDRYAAILAALGKLYGDAFMVVESNNHGLSTLIVLRDHYRYKHLYVQRDLDSRGSNDKETKALGFMTTARSKFILIDGLAQALAEKTHGISCIETIKEMQTYIVEANGSYNAQVGCHDDRVMSYAMAQMAVKANYLFRPSIPNY